MDGNRGAAPMKMGVRPRCGARCLPYSWVTAHAPAFKHGFMPMIVCLVKPTSDIERTAQRDDALVEATQLQHALPSSRRQHRAARKAHVVLRQVMRIGLVDDDTNLRTLPDLPALSLSGRRQSTLDVQLGAAHAKTPRVILCAATVTLSVPRRSCCCCGGGAPCVRSGGASALAGTRPVAAASA